VPAAGPVHLGAGSRVLRGGSEIGIKVMSVSEKVLTDELRETRRMLAALFQGAVTADSVDLLDDEQLRAKFPGMSLSKFNTILARGPTRGRQERSRDFRVIDNFYIGNKRYWRMDSYLAFIRGEV